LHGKQVTGGSLFQLRYQIPGVTVLTGHTVLRLVVVAITQQFYAFQPQGGDITLAQNIGIAIGAERGALRFRGCCRLAAIAWRSVEAV